MHGSQITAPARKLKLPEPAASVRNPHQSSPLNEFTGERVIPGQVDVDLWNEHRARYAFAARLSRHKRVLDLGCGSGYGSFELARLANSVAGLDVSLEAVEYSADHFRAGNLQWAVASATATPFRDGTFDLVVAFEVIEHLSAWRDLLTEARRLLAPGGQFIVSTPNKLYYAESRGVHGANPFHEHEFEFGEFEAALREVFPHVSLFLEDHTEGVLFQSIPNARGADVRLDRDNAEPQAASFFIAVCAMTQQTGSPTFVYIPASGNVLRERELHIRRLEDELKTKDQWLAAARTEHADLVELFRKQKAELEDRNKWAQRLSDDLTAAGQRIVHLQHEVAELAEGYESQVHELEEENRRKTAWAEETDARLSAELELKCQELAQAVELLQRAESTVEERTTWALRLQAEKEQLEAKVSMVEASRWIRLGRAIGLGPRLQDR
jgi:SAM-dependent methyltransferase